MSAEQTPDIAAVHAVIRDRLHSLRWHDQGAWPTEAETCAPCDQDADQLAAALAPVLAAAVREAEQRALREAADAAQFGVAGPDWAGPVSMWLRDRADRITEPVSHEAATSGEEASKA